MVDPVRGAPIMKTGWQLGGASPNSASLARSHSEIAGVTTRSLVRAAIALSVLTQANSRGAIRGKLLHHFRRTTGEHLVSLRERFRDDGSGSHDSMLAQRNAGQDDRIGAEPAIRH